MIYCRFICSGQSGHTVLSHILDSHPNCIISEEVGIVTKVTRRDWKLAEIITRIEESSDQVMRVYAACGTWERPYGSYRNKFGRLTEWNGRHKDLKVIGDKCGWDCLDRPKSTETLERRLGIPVKTICLLRNPFDLISSMYLGHKKSRKRKDEPSLVKQIEDIKILTERLDSLINSNTLVVKLEDLIFNPIDNIKNIFKFLTLNEYLPTLLAAQGVLFKSPKSQRNRVPWKRKEVSEVFNLINKYEFYKGYK